MFWLIILIFVVILALRLYIYGNDDYWTKQNIPCVLGSEIGSFWKRILMRIPFHELDERIYHKLKTFGKIKFGGILEFRRPVIFLMDLDLIKNITVKDFDHFLNRRPFGIQKNDPSLFDKMLFVMEAPEWKDTRSAMSPTFSTGKIRRMFTIINTSSIKLTEYLTKEIKIHGDVGDTIELDLRGPCSRCTLDVIASTAFGVESNNFTEENSIFTRMGKRVQNQFTGLGVFKIFMAMLLPEVSKMLKISFLDPIAINFFKDVIKKTIKYRRETGERREDFLQLLLDVRDGQLLIEDEDESMIIEEKSQKKVNSAVEWTDEMILAQSLLFFLAGVDATESFIGYVLYELALNPDIQEKLVKELEIAIENEGNNGSLTYDIVNQNEYLDMIANETLRKYPPATRTERKCTTEYQIPGTSTIIPKDRICIIPIWSIHHDPEYYPDPEKFIPGRFSAENKKDRNPYTWMPFGTGPRNCIAMRFALIKSKTIIANLVLQFKIEPCKKTQIPMVFATAANLKPKYGMWLKLSPRN